MGISKGTKKILIGAGATAASLALLAGAAYYANRAHQKQNGPFAPYITREHYERENKKRQKMMDDYDAMIKLAEESRSEEQKQEVAERKRKERVQYIIQRAYDKNMRDPEFRESIESFTKRRRNMKNISQTQINRSNGTLDDFNFDID